MNNSAAEDPLFTSLVMRKDSYLHHINLNQKGRPGAGESLPTWSSKQIEARPGAFRSVST